MNVMHTVRQAPIGAVSSRVVRLALLLALASAFAGCGAATVKPWDRDLFADPRMSFTPSPLENAIDEHVYFSKEGSAGGISAGGGGCGCN